MKRQIKFRVWHNTLNKFLTSDEWYLGLDGELMFVNIYDDCGPNPVAAPNLYVIQQFTGLTDKNGKDIYEGDIIAIVMQDGSYLEVKEVNFTKTKNHECYGHNNYGDSTIVGYYFRGYHGGPDSYTIIGNIHENPELLKKYTKNL